MKIYVFHYSISSNDYNLGHLDIWLIELIFHLIFLILIFFPYQIFSYFRFAKFLLFYHLFFIIRVFVIIILFFLELNFLKLFLHFFWFHFFIFHLAWVIIMIMVQLWSVLLIIKTLSFYPQNLYLKLQLILSFYIIYLIYHIFHNLIHQN